jgi:hypothetical protein
MDQGHFDRCSLGHAPQAQSIDLKVDVANDRVLNALRRYGLFDLGMSFS